MTAFITPKDLQRIKGYAYITAQRKIQKVKLKYNCKNVTVQQFCEYFNENYLEIFAMLNAKNELEYLRLMKEGAKEGYAVGFKGVLMGLA
ncbi:hypothetical protein [Emticicia sp. 17c]|uniref:hypothetical protein n=1 Tax=Emticicia sp. 17c TaxID=3127704 RepID=UPI00301BC422